MLNSRQRPLVYGAITIVFVWLVAWGGYTWAKNSKATPEKLAAYMRETDLHKLSGDARKRALKKLADQLNGLQREERRRARLDREWNEWLEAMTDDEKNEFLDATLPTGFKQMLDAFEQLPADKRRLAVQDALKKLKEAQIQPDGSDGMRPPGKMDEGLQKKMTEVGLKTYYTQSSAQSKAELAPLMEEIQHSMESGRFFRR